MVFEDVRPQLGELDCFAVDWRDAAQRGYSDARDCNEGEIYAADDTRADGAQLHGGTEVSALHAAARGHPRQVKGGFSGTGSPSVCRSARGTVTETPA